MKISLKNMIISFILALIVFSLIMTVVCVSIYRAKVDVKTDDVGSSVVGALVARREKYNFSKTALYYSTSSDNAFRFAVIVGISEEEKKLVMTPVERYYAIQYQDAFYFLSSIWEREGERMLEPLAELLTANIPETVSESASLGLSRADDMNDFYEQIRAVLAREYQGYSVERIDVVINSESSESAQGRVIDCQKTVEQFFIHK